MDIKKKDLQCVTKHRLLKDKELAKIYNSVIEEMVSQADAGEVSFRYFCKDSQYYHKLGTLFKLDGFNVECYTDANYLMVINWGE